MVPGGKIWSPWGGKGVVRCRLGSGVWSEQCLGVWVLVWFLAGSHGEHPLPRFMPAPRVLVVGVTTTATMLWWLVHVEVALWVWLGVVRVWLGIVRVWLGIVRVWLGVGVVQIVGELL